MSNLESQSRSRTSFHATETGRWFDGGVSNTLSTAFMQGTFFTVICGMKISFPKEIMLVQPLFPPIEVNSTSIGVEKLTGDLSDLKTEPLDWRAGHPTASNLQKVEGVDEDAG